MPRAWLGLGANIGDPPAQVREAVDRLNAWPGIAVVAQSSMLITKPWGKTDQPDFSNMVVEVETSLAPLELLDACLGIEREMGRVRDIRWGPRRIDIDVTISDTANIARARKTLLGIAERDKRVLAEPAANAFVSGFGTTTVTLEMRLWVKTPDYRAAQRDLTEAVKLGINKMLAASDGGIAEVKEAADPHVAQSGAQTPELDPGK